MKTLGIIFPLLFQAMVVAQEIPTDLSQKNKPQTIKVLLTQELSSLLLEVKGRYQVVDPTTGFEISSELMNKRQPLVATQNGIQWGELFPGIYHVRFVPQNAKTSILINGIQYRGCIEVYQIKDIPNALQKLEFQQSRRPKFEPGAADIEADPVKHRVDADGLKVRDAGAAENPFLKPVRYKLQIINEVDVESYLKSILTHLFPEKMEETVLEAVAVVARTNAYYLASKHVQRDWHIEAKESGYEGYALTLQNLKVDQAVDKTRQVILTYKNAPFATTWTKDSAGKTAPFSSIFRKNTPSPQGVNIPINAAKREMRRWSLTLPLVKLAELAQLPKISEIYAFRDKASEKVYALRFKDGENHKDLDFFALQKQFGSDQIRSNDFTITLKGEQAIFTGFGEGHGVGLCLYSALQMAKEGNSAKKILRTFFPETEFHVE
jgi:stage II sporulation protein D